jgi:tRNA/tmRNA/rRNA uracil-C5-methylase (TrmA/RlmC/RlmD family)
VIGVTGVAIQTTYIDKMLKRFREKYNFKVTFFNEQGKTILSEKDHNTYTSIGASPLLKPYFDKIISKKSHLLELKRKNETYIIHTKYIEDLNLYLMIEVNPSAYTKDLKAILLFNLLSSLGVVLFIVIILYRMIQKHSTKLEELAFMIHLLHYTTDDILKQNFQRRS